MNTKYTKKITSLALMSLFSASAFAAGVATSTDELKTPTLDALNGTTIYYGDGQSIEITEYSAYTLTEINAEDLESYSEGEYITKYLDNGDGTYTAVYYSIEYSSEIITPTKTNTSYTGAFLNNTNSGNGGAIYNYYGATTTITGDFIGNSSASGGAIYNDNTISAITGDFIYNSASSGGAIYNKTGTIGAITGDFIDNSTTGNGGAIYNAGTISTITGDFIGNSAFSSASYYHGGAIYNSGGTISAITGDFIGNSSSNNGGAIFNSSGIITFLALDDDVNFTGNYVGSSSYTSNAIYNYGYSSSTIATINFNAYGDYSILVNDGIRGSSSSSYVAYQILNINSESNGDNAYGTVEFNNSVAYQTVNVIAGTLKLGSYAGGYVNEEYTALESKASLSNSYLNVKSGATLSVATSVNLTSSSITLESGSTLLFEASASLIFDETSSISISVVEDGTFSIVFEVGAGATIGETDIYAYFSNTDNLSSILDTEAMDDEVSISSDSISLTTEEGLSYTSGEAYSFELSGTVGADGAVSVSLSSAPTAAVPEPSTYAMIIGLLSLGFVAYRRRK